MKKVILIISLGIVCFLISCEGNYGLSNKSYSVAFVNNVTEDIATFNTGEDGKVIKPDDPTRVGYNFKGWYYDWELTIPYDFNTSLNRDVTLYAKWEIKPLVVKIIDQNKEYTSYHFNYGDKLENLKDPTKEGYLFDGFFFDETLQQPYLYEEPLILTEDLNLYIKWQLKNYNITFNIDQEVISTKTYKYGTLISDIEIPSKEHYVFDGWYQDIKYQKKFNSDAKITKDMTLFAKFLPEVYTVNFYDETTLICEEKASYQTKIYSIFNEEKTGYHLEKLYYDKDYLKEVKEDDEINKDLNLYVKWEINQYAVNLYIDGKIYLCVDIAYLSRVESIEKPIKAHYVFDGWYRDEELTDKVDEDYQITNNLNLYATFKIEEFKITIYDNNLVLKTINIAYGKKLTEIGEILKTGYHLINLYYDEECLEVVDLETEVTKNLNLYTKWEINKYIVRLYVDGKFFNNIEVSYLTKVETILKPTKDHYVFDGWYRDENCNKKVSDNDVIKDNLNLYGKFKIEELKITIYDNKLVLKTINIAYGKKLTEIGEILKTGYHLINLYYDENCLEVVDFETEVTENLNLYTKWEINEYMINFYVDGILYHTEKLSYLQKIDHIIKPTKDHYDFNGWYSDENCTKKINDNYQVTSDVNLYGKFSLVKVLVTIYDGKKVLNKIKLDYGSKLNQIKVEKMGYHLEGYYQDELLNNWCDLENEIFTDMILYTKWEINEYQITLVIDEEEIKIITKKYLENLLDIEKPLKDGFIFQGWYLDQNFEKEYLLQTEITSDLKLYAKWLDLTKVPYQVVYMLENLDDDNYTMFKKETLYGVYLSEVKAPILEFSGFVGPSYDVKGIVRYEEELVLKVYYQRALYKINFVVDDLVRYTFENIKYETNFVPLKDYLVDGYIIYGWYLDGDFNNKLPDNLKITTDIFIYGKAEKIIPGTDGLEYELNNEKNGYEIVGYHGNSSEVMIPNGYNHLKVISVISLSENHLIKNVTILPNVVEIKKEAFRNCYNLETVNLPDTIVKIDDFAFINCTMLKTLTIPELTNEIGMGTFYNCSSLEKIIVSKNNNIYLDDNGILINKKTSSLILFPAKHASVSYQIPADIKEIARAAFTNLINLQTIDLGNIIKIAEENFIDCEKLEMVTIGENLNMIPDTCFLNNFYLNNFKVNINNKSFKSEDGILYNYDQTILMRYPSFKEEQVFVMKDSVMKVLYGAFNKPKLTTIVFSKNLVYLDPYSFDNLKNVKIYTYAYRYYPSWHQTAFNGDYQIYFYNDWSFDELLNEVDSGK